MRRKRILGSGVSCYHCMSRTVNGERLFMDREKEVLRKMLWQVADFSGVEVLTYALMANHLHVLVRVPDVEDRLAISDLELLRRWRVLYPKPTKYETATALAMERILREGGDEAAALRARLLVRMGDVSAFMKTLKQRFTIWFNKSHERYGPLWSDRFKSVLVEGKGNPLQTMAAYIDLNPVRAGVVRDPKDYRYCGYAEAVAGAGEPGRRAREGLRIIWSAFADGSRRGGISQREAMQQHRSLIFAKGAERGSEADREAMLRILEKEDGILPKGAVLRCRIRYFTDGAILGTAEFVRVYVEAWSLEKTHKRRPKVNAMRGADWGDLTVIRGLRRRVFM